MQEVKANSHNYDAWFDYLRLMESEGDVEVVRDLYERAISNVPPSRVSMHSYKTASRFHCDVNVLLSILGKAPLASLHLLVDQLRHLRGDAGGRRGSSASGVRSVSGTDSAQELHLRQDLDHVRALRSSTEELDESAKDHGVTDTCDTSP